MATSAMSLRLARRTLRLVRATGSGSALRPAPSVRHRAAVAQLAENAASSAARQISSSAPAAAQDVPLTAQAHGPIKQNPELAGQVRFRCLVS
jgi:hypothetical protein